MKTYVINLASSLDRRNNIISKSLNIDTEIHFIDAINGNELDKNYLNSISSNSINNINRILSPSEIGCYLSHIQAVKSFILTKEPICLIIEDDVYFSSHINSFIKTVTNVESYPFDILLAGYRNGYYSYWHQLKFEKIDLVRFTDCGYGAHGYLLTQAGAKKIIENNLIPHWPYDYVTGGKADLSLKIYGLKEKIILLEPTLSNASSIELQRNALHEYSRNDEVKSYFSIIKKVLKKIKPIRRYKN